MNGEAFGPTEVGPFPKPGPFPKRGTLPEYRDCFHATSSEAKPKAQSPAPKAQTQRHVTNVNHAHPIINVSNVIGTPTRR